MAEPCPDERQTEPTEPTGGTPGELMRNARIAARKTQAQIALELGVTQPQIAQWEGGKSYPTTPVVRRVAEVYGLRPEQLLPETGRA